MGHDETTDQKDGKGQRNFSLEDLCPFTEDPHEACYCYDMTKRQNISLAMYYCGKNFKECKLYKKILKERNRI
ncbi:MAG: hypothetical protein HWN69_08285 [Desulfobacterales bacterium]|nr:hypothetical protein [Desulfobacterales bacterium]